ncbi:MAG: RidA family protein [Dehalococcoidia bacterium]
MAKHVIIPDTMRQTYGRFHFAPAVRHGDRIYCSGQLGLDDAGRPIEDPEAQFARAFEDVRAVLEVAGVGLDEIVEMTTFHVDMAQHLRTFMRVKDRFISEPYPAWTAIGVSSLAVPGALVEIKVIAAAE